MPSRQRVAKPSNGLFMITSWRMLIGAEWGAGIVENRPCGRQSRKAISMMAFLNGRCGQKTQRHGSASLPPAGQQAIADAAGGEFAQVPPVLPCAEGFVAPRAVLDVGVARRPQPHL